MTDSLKLSLPFATLYILEMAMTSSPLANFPTGDAVNVVTITSSEFTEVLTAAHNSLDTFLSLDIPSIRTLPIPYFVQITHAAILLLKLYFAAARQPGYLDAPQKLWDIKADDYLRRLVKKFSGWNTLWPIQKLAQTFRKLQEPLQQYGNQRLASELAFLDAWSLEEASGVGFDLEMNANQGQSDLGEKETSLLQNPGFSEGGIRPTSNEDVSAWTLTEMGQISAMQDLTPVALPSASLDAAQLINWFGTDLNTSTFDFDGNLQSIIQSSE